MDYKYKANKIQHGIDYKIEKPKCIHLEIVLPKANWAELLDFLDSSLILKKKCLFSQPSRGRPDRAERGEAHLNDVRFNSN